MNKKCFIQFLVICFFAQFCASGNERTTMCSDRYSECISRCDRDIAELIGLDDDQKEKRMDACHRDCEARYDECIERVKVWDDVPVR